MTTPTLYRRTIQGFGARIETVHDGQWHDPVPCCPDWDVRGLVAHVTGEALWTPPLLRDEPPDEVDARVQELVSSDDLRPVWDRAAREAVAAVEEPGAGERRVQTSAGEVSGGEFVAEVFADTLIHTWDLARATGGDDRLDPEAVDACTAWFAEREEEWRRRGAIGPPAVTPPGADAQTRLLAAFGREG